MEEFRNRFIAQLSKDVEEGLSAPSKYLKSKYFYDAAGDLLFQRITHLPEYYLTLCENEILHFKGKEILNGFSKDKRLNIIELGSGDGIKTKLLLEAASQLQLNLTYYPVDISPDVLKLAQENTDTLAYVIPISADYSEILSTEPFHKLSNKLVLFLGSNIGNFNANETAEFMKYLWAGLSSGDHVLIGFDLIKDPKIILKAYNDPTGLTSEFNLNLLAVLNRELGADFDKENFFHAPIYDEQLQAAKSFLVSNKKHDVFFKQLNKTFHFEKGESIHTEISSKYSLETIEKLAAAGGFKIASKHFDRKNYFVDVLLVKK